MLVTDIAVIAAALPTVTRTRGNLDNLHFLYLLAFLTTTASLTAGYGRTRLQQVEQEETPGTWHDHHRGAWGLHSPREEGGLQQLVGSWLQDRG